MAGKNGLINLSYTFLIYGGINIGSKDRAPESDDKGTLFSESMLGPKCKSA